MPTDFAGADKKLRQAEFFRNHLRHQSKEIARSMNRGGDADYKFALEAYCSASLNAAQSCFYILNETGGPAFKQIESNWRNKTLDQPARARFHALMNLRGRDVHFGDLPGEALPKMIEMQEDGDHSAHYSNPAIFGPRVMTQHTNPDGAIVRAHGGLRGSVGLYVELCGERLEALTACTNFVDQLRSLVQALRVAELPDAGGEPDSPTPVA
jgi:hypothetical protein